MTGDSVTIGGAPLGFADSTSAAGPAALDKGPDAHELAGADPARGARCGVGLGVNTGFGALKSVRIPEADVERLRRISSGHAAGAGPELEPRRSARAVLARTRSRLSGGVRVG